MNKIKPVIYKSNLIVEASYKLSIGEQRIIHILTSMIDKDDKEFKSYCFTGIAPESPYQACTVLAMG